MCMLFYTLMMVNELNLKSVTKFVRLLQILQKTEWRRPFFRLSGSSVFCKHPFFFLHWIKALVASNSCQFRGLDGGKECATWCSCGQFLKCHGRWSLTVTLNHPSLEPFIKFIILTLRIASKLPFMHCQLSHDSQACGLISVRSSFNYYIICQCHR